MPERKVLTADAAVGMVVSQALTDSQGRIIMTPGTRLTPAHIKRLDRWGISELFIADEAELVADNEVQETQSEAETLQLDKNYMQQLAEIFKIRFHEVNGITIMEQIKKIAFKNVVLAGRGGIPGVSVKKRMDK